MMSKQVCRGVLPMSVLLLLLTQFPLCGQDKAGVWTLDVKFENPKTKKVPIPGRGERTVWYLEYEVTNKTKEPRSFHPIFHLVSDKGNKQVPDEILPTVQDKIGGGLKNSISVSTKAIPPGGKIQAVAIWDGIDPTATHFTVYLRGLSNGTVIHEKTIRYKTLHMKFQRDAKAQDIRPAGAQEWIYRERTIEKLKASLGPTKRST
jgi:hypothetical protein